MPTKITVYDLLISCPSDISPYIEYLKTAICYFNDHYGRRNNIGIRPIYWSKDTYSTMGKSPQNEINEQIVNKSDMVVSVFWTRFGTKTDKFDSGTEEEIESFIEDSKQVFLYFMNKNLELDKIDFQQYKKVLNFKEKHRQDGLYFTVSDEKELARKFHEDLELYFDSIIKGADLKRKGVSKEILWVDDRPENNVYERKMLERYGVEFSLALNTRQALEALNNKDFALIISDMGRKEGEREGYVLLEELRKTDSKTPFIIYAGSKAPEHVKEAQRRGSQGCTNEPMELKDMVIQNLLNPCNV